MQITLMILSQLEKILIQLSTRIKHMESNIHAGGQNSLFCSLRSRSISYQLLCLYFNTLERIPSFSVLNSWHVHAGAHPNKDSKQLHHKMKHEHIWLKMSLLQVNLQNDSQLHVICFVHISPI